MTQIFDDRPCQLGEGPLWHPERSQLFWFDILGKRLLSNVLGQKLVWNFDRHVSAAGWVDGDTLLVASDQALLLLDLTSGQTSHLIDLEADNPVTRSNDGRADPLGGFWIGTMGLNAEPGAGTIYRYFRGELRPLFRGLTITNSICFAPDGTTAYFSDTSTKRIMAQTLDAEGWPDGAPRLLIDLTDSDRDPDGAVVDAEGCLWVAIWGKNEVIRISPEGRILQSITLPAIQPSCPAFGGPGHHVLYVTSAWDSLNSRGPSDGCTLMLPDVGTGQSEHRVIISRSRCHD